MQTLMRYRDLLLPIGLIGCLVVILVPLPSVLMDLLLAANITVGVLILLTTIHISTPLEFSVFPSLLLATTLSRLVLNVATTRLILTRAETEGANAAGKMIRSFGEFVAGDRIEVGIIIFLILVIIQFVVITKGATRISEVAARFALDGMPGRQMAIDADLNAGLINDKQAQERREEISAQADFYGGMDGASKFVRGDAIAGIIITVVNIFGGLYIGWAHADMNFGEAATVFTKLSIGDGLVSQIPALLISLAAALLVTRSAKKTNLPLEFLRQLLGNTKALTVAGVFLLLLVLTNLPTVPMATLGVGCIGLAVVMNRQASRRLEEEQNRLEAQQSEADDPAPRRVEDFLAVDPMEISIGVGLLGLADPNLGGDLMQRITNVRHLIASDLGIILPKVRVRDDRNLEEYEYEIRIHGDSVARNQLQPTRSLAVEVGQITGSIEGELVTDPVTSNRAYWIDDSTCEQAEIFGYSTLRSAAVLTAHLRAIANQYADELLSRDATKHLLDELKEVCPTVVDELIPTSMKVSEVQQVLHLLLKEDIPIRQLGMILEALGDFSSRTKDPVLLSEKVRHRLARTISSRYRDEDGRIHVMVLDPKLEDQVEAGIEHSDFGISVRMSPEGVERVCNRIRDAIAENLPKSLDQIVLVNPRIRAGLRQITSSALPAMRIVSYNEITQDTKIKSYGLINDE